MDAGRGALACCFNYSDDSVMLYLKRLLEYYTMLCLQWHLPELDFPAQGDRRTTTIDNDSEKPLWAERMNLRGEVQGPQSATIFGHRQEYLPANKSRARSMVRLSLLPVLLL